MVINYCIMKAATRKLLFTAILSICFVATVSADLTKQINAIITQSSQKKVRFSVHVVKANTGKTVYSRNIIQPMIPASNMKLITTAAALKLLPKNFEYVTKVGFLDGSIVILASGDPLLGDKVTDAKYNRQVGWIFDDITAALKKNNIKTIKNIIIDTGIFDDQRVHPNWPIDQLNRSYACEVSALNYNGNCIEVTTKNLGSRVAVSIEPKTAFVQLINKVKPISTGKGAVGAYRNHTPNKITIKGKCKKQQGPFEVAIERPAAFFGFLLAEKLAESGITITGQFIENSEMSHKKIKSLVTYTTNLSDVLTRSNKDSFSLAAESLLKTTAAYAAPDRKNVGWPQARQTVSQYLRSLGIDDNQFYIDDGSGLSKQNKLSTNTITAVLLDVYKGKNWPIYKDSLAVGGIDGTIARYFKEKKYLGKIIGKTGYVVGVKSFSGLCTTPNGDYIFSILTNSANGTTRPAINNIAKAIINNYSN